MTEQEALEIAHSMFCRMIEEGMGPFCGPNGIITGAILAMRAIDTETGEEAIISLNYPTNLGMSEKLGILAVLGSIIMEDIS